MVVGPLPISYQFATYACYLEFFLVIVIIISASLVSAYRHVRIRRDIKIKQVIEKMLIHINDKRLLFNPKSIPFLWKKLPILLSVVDTLDMREHNEHWISLRPMFIKSIMFPSAINSATSCRWQDRLYAVRSFGLLRDSSNHRYIEALVNDRIPLVAIYAGKVALLNHSEAAINSLIHRIGHERWGAQLIDLHSFNVYPPESKPYFIKKLQLATKPRIRAACYKILTRYKPARLSWDISDDVFSEDKELKIAAIKFVTHEDRAAAIPLILKLMSVEKNNQVRLIALHCLSILRSNDAIPILTTCLSDEHWWIKVSAAEALKKLGPKGVAVLKAHDIDIDAVTYNINHILNTWW